MFGYNTSVLIRSPILGGSRQVIYRRNAELLEVDAMQLELIYRGVKHTVYVEDR